MTKRYILALAASAVTTIALAEGAANISAGSASDKNATVRANNDPLINRDLHQSRAGRKDNTTPSGTVISGTGKDSSTTLGAGNSVPVSAQPPAGSVTLRPGDDVSVNSGTVGGNVNPSVPTVTAGTDVNASGTPVPASGDNANRVPSEPIIAAPGGRVIQGTDNSNTGAGSLGRPGQGPVTAQNGTSEANPADASSNPTAQAASGRLSGRSGPTTPVRPGSNQFEPHGGVSGSTDRSTGGGSGMSGGTSSGAGAGVSGGTGGAGGSAGSGTGGR